MLSSASLLSLRVVFTSIKFTCERQTDKGSHRDDRQQMSRSFTPRLQARHQPISFPAVRAREGSPRSVHAHTALLDL